MSTIRKILFPSGIGTQVNGLDDSQAIALSNFENLVAPSAIRGGVVGQLLPAREVSGLFDIEGFKVNGTRGTSYKFAPSYDFLIGPVETGINLPLKFSSLNDPLHTDAYNVGLDLHGSYTIVGKGKSDWALGAVGGAFINSLVFTADAIDLTGYLRYGGFVGGKGRVTIGPVIVVGGATYAASQVSIPDALISDDLRPFVKAIEDRPVDQQVIFGANLIYPFLPNFMLNLRTSRTQTLGASTIEEGKQDFTRLQATLSFFLTQKWALDIGYGRVFGTKGLEFQDGFIFGRYSFDFLQ